jgi:transposase
VEVIQLAPQMRILVAIEPVDLRKGIDGLAQLCREKLGADSFSGYLFIFRGRRATAIKLLAYDGQGFGVCKSGFPKDASAGGPPARSRRAGCRCNQVQLVLTVVFALDDDPAVIAECVRETLER